MLKTGSGWIVASVLAVMLTQPGTATSASIRGQILATPERLSEPLEVLLRKGGKVIANTLSDNSGIYDVNTIANYDPEIIPFLDSPFDTAFERDPRSGLFMRIDSREEGQRQGHGQGHGCDGGEDRR